MSGSSQAAPNEAGNKQKQAEAKPAAQAKPVTNAATDDSDAAIAGTVLDANANPVAGATVWLLGGSWSDELLTHRAETISDDQGRFFFRQFTADELFKPVGDQQFPSIIARDKSRRLGWIDNFQAPQAKTIKLKLHEVDDFRGQLVDVSGEPVDGAKVRPQGLNIMRVEDGGSTGISLTRELFEQWETTTADDGRFTLLNVPLDGSFTARVTAAGFGSPTVRWNLGKDVAISLGHAGGIAGTIGLPEQITQPDALTLDLSRQADAALKEAAYRIGYSTSLAVARDGNFEFRDLPPGAYVISLSRKRPLALYADPTPPLDVAAGECVDVHYPLHRAMVVRGVAIDNRDKQPLKDVVVRLVTLKSADVGQYVSSDEQGRFTAYVRPGEVLIQPWQTPPGHLSALLNGDCETIEVSQDIETIVEVERAVEVAGVVVDEQGRPVDGAEIQPATPWRVSRHGAPPIVRADAEGRFILKDIDPADNLALRARSQTAVSNGVVLLRPAQLAEPVQVRIDQANASHLTGRVIEEGGIPVKGARLSLQSLRGDQSVRIPKGRSMFTNVFVEEIVTDDEGRFRSAAIWPRDSYQAAVMVDGYDRAETKQLTGLAGKTLDFGTIVLRRSGAAVAGRLVDSSGKPIAGATVFNSGDAARPISMITDASGQFRLDGLFGGQVYIFARKDGHRFTGMRTTSGSKDVELHLLRQDEPPTDQPAAPSGDASPQQQLAHWMLEQLWQLPNAENKWVLVRCMARLDRDRAEVWAAQLGEPNEKQVSIGVSERLLNLARQPNLPINYDEALTLADGLSDQRGWDMLKSLAELTAVRNPQKSLQFVEKARLRTGNLGLRSTPLRAQLGSLLARLGQVNEGRKLIDEAANEAEHSPQNWSAAQDVVAVLAAYDMARAKKLAEAVVGDPFGRNRVLAELASALATRDLNEALATAGKISGDVNANGVRNHALMEIAYQLAAKRREEARQVLELMDGGDADKIRAEALGWLAIAIAPRDKKTAYKLIDESLELLLNRPEAFRSWGNYGGRCVQAAWVARQASEIGYPDMRSVVMRVLATRPTTEDEFNPIRRLEANVAMALVLGFSAPDVARQVLRACEPEGHLVGSGYSSIRRGEWIEAWCLADPGRAKAVVERELAALASAEKVDLRRSEIVQAADLLSLPAAQWPRHFAVDFGAFWFPGEEWLIRNGRLRP